jgi:hypothetical protein
LAILAYAIELAPIILAIVLVRSVDKIQHATCNPIAAQDQAEPSDGQIE